MYTASILDQTTGVVVDSKPFDTLSDAMVWAAGRVAVLPNTRYDVA